MTVPDLDDTIRRILLVAADLGDNDPDPVLPSRIAALAAGVRGRPPPRGRVHATTWFTTSDGRRRLQDSLVQAAAHLSIARRMVAVGEVADMYLDVAGVALEEAAGGLEK